MCSPENAAKHDVLELFEKLLVSGGYIRIKVLDSKRFNEEIFLGEITFLLSSLLVPRRNHSVSIVNGLVPVHIDMAHSH